LPDAAALQASMTTTALQNWTEAEQKSATPAENTGSDVETLVLGKDRTVILMPDNTLPYTSVTMLLSGGERLLAPDQQGLSAFTASLLTKGAGKLDAAAVEDFQSDRAASLDASTGRQSFTLSMNYPSRFAADMFWLLENTLAAPAMKKMEAARVRENQIAAITSQEDKPTGLAFRRLFPFLFPEHPYGFLQLGEASQVERFTEKDARSFWRKQVRQPWVLTVCGSFDREAILEAIHKLPAPDAAAESLPAPLWGTAKILNLSLPGRNQAHLLMVFPTVGVGNPDEPGLDLLQNILAGQGGLLFRDLRDAQGLGYTVTAFSWKAEQAGGLIFYIGTSPDMLEQARKGFETVIAGLHAAPLAPEEMERGKKQMTGDYYRDHQTLASRSTEAAVLSLLRRPLDAAKNNVAVAQTLTAADMQTLARKYLQTDKAYIIIVRP
jgi:zinc protease